MSDLNALIAAQERQITSLTRNVERLADNVGALVAAVAALLGEELGVPVQEQAEPAGETDFDGRPI